VGIQADYCRKFLRILFWDMTPCHLIIEMSRNKAPALLQKVTNQLHSNASHPRKNGSLCSSAVKTSRLNISVQCNIKFGWFIMGLIFEKNQSCHFCRWLKMVIFFVAQNQM